MSGLDLSDLPKEVLLDIMKLIPYQDIISALNLNKELSKKLLKSGKKMYTNRRLEELYGISVSDMINSETLYNKLETRYNVLLRRRLFLQDLKIYVNSGADDYFDTVYKYLLTIPPNKTYLNDEEKTQINDFIDQYYTDVRIENAGDIREDYLIGTLTQLYLDYGRGIFSEMRLK